MSLGLLTLLASPGLLVLVAASLWVRRQGAGTHGICGGSCAVGGCEHGAVGDVGTAQGSESAEEGRLSTGGRVRMGGPELSLTS